MKAIDPTVFLPASISKETAAFNQGIHAFNAFPITLAEQANTCMEAFIRQHVQRFFSTP
jgi:hypothetical protein